MNPQTKQNRRTIHYVDHTLQRFLLVALVVLETLLAGAAIWALYLALGEIVEADMYRIHLTQRHQILPALLSEGLKVLGAMLLVNVAALLLADRIWALYVNRILRDLDDLIHSAHRLDFVEQGSGRCHHAVLDHAMQWRGSEAAALKRSRDTIQALPTLLPATAQERGALAARLQGLLQAR